MKHLHNLLYKSYVMLYRIFAAFVLYAMILAIFCYITVMGFYTISRTWTAPLLISPTNTQILALTQSIVSSQVQLESVTLDRARQSVTVTQTEAQLEEMKKLRTELVEAINRENKSNKTEGPELAGLNVQKKQDIRDTAAVMKDVDTVQKQISAELAAGLMTKGDAATQRATLNSILTGYTDNKVQEVLLRDSVRQKTTKDLTSMDALTKKATLETEIAQFEIIVLTGKQQIETDDSQIKGITAAINTAKRSPYYLASVSKTNLYFSFVPYDNDKIAKVGAPVYDCYLNVIACRYVGAVKAVFTDEEHVVNPISGSDMRGHLIQLDLIHPDSVKSKTLFINGKPFLI